MDENKNMEEVVEDVEPMSEQEEDMWGDDLAGESEFPATEDDESYEESTEGEAEADQQTAEDSDADDGTDEPQHEEAPKTKKRTLKHMDESREVDFDNDKDIEDVVGLAQKGMDYDRIRADRDSYKDKFNELNDFLEEIKGDFSSVQELMNDTRAQLMAKNEKISYDKALEKVKANQQAATAPKQNDIGIDAFVQAYPDVKADTIPKEVWDDVQRTGNLVASYENYANKTKAKELSETVESLKKEIEILKQNNKNSARSAGSSKSAGKGTGMSEEDEMWYADD